MMASVANAQGGVLVRLSKPEDMDAAWKTLRTLPQPIAGADITEFGKPSQPPSPRPSRCRRPTPYSLLPTPSGSAQRDIGGAFRQLFAEAALIELGDQSALELVTFVEE